MEFRIDGLQLLPTEVTQKLGLEPSQIRLHVPSDGARKERKALWAFDGSPPDKEWPDLEEGLIFLLDKLLPLGPIIKNSFGEFNCYFWCGHFQTSFSGGPSLSPEVLHKLACFGVRLNLENYFSED